jgi:hypothetical protein
VLNSSGRAVEDHRFAGVQPAQRGQVADLGGGQFRGCGEVEALNGGLFLEPTALSVTADLVADFITGS